MMSNKNTFLEQMLDLIEEYKEVRKHYKDREEFDKIQDYEPILFEGVPNAEVMIIARDLGRNEVLNKIPLIGSAGKLVRYCLDRENYSYHITNLVPYKPKNNIAFPKPIRERFFPLLIKQINIVRPKVIITLGKLTTEAIYGSNIGGLQKFIWDNTLSETPFYNLDVGIKNSFKFRPCLHPSYLLRKGINIDNIEEKEKLLMDFVNGIHMTDPLLTFMNAFKI